MSELRVIKKYPNRRLYDTEISSYITLEDIRALVLGNVAFCVRDAKSKEDITRSILLQIILEQEEDGQPIFSEEVLSQFIRFYGDSLQGAISAYLDRTVGLFVEHQKMMRDQVEQVMTGDPLGFMREITEKNMSVWQDMQSNFFKAATGGEPVTPPAPKTKGKGRPKS